eukprot:239097_1
MHAKSTQFKILEHKDKPPINEAFYMTRKSTQWRHQMHTDEEKMKNAKEILNEDIEENMHACSCMGCYDELLSYFQCAIQSSSSVIDDYVEYLVEALVATQKCDLYSLSTNVKSSGCPSQYFYRAILCVESRNNPDFHEQIWCFFMFLEHELTKREYEIEHKIDDASFDYQDNHCKIVHGYLNVFCSSLFAKYSQESIDETMRQAIHFDAFDIQFCKKRGFLQVLEGIKYRKEIEDLKHATHTEIEEYYIEHEKKEWYMIGAVFVQQKQYYKAMDAFVRCAVGTSSLLIRALCFRDLSEACLANKFYLVAFKLLKRCYNICNGYFFPSFVKQHFPVRKKLLKKMIKLNMSKCNHCEIVIQTKLCCSGCMSAIYCSRRCQKLHWKNCHYLKCTRKFEQLYQKLKPLLILFKSCNSIVIEACNEVINSFNCNQ